MKISREKALPFIMAALREDVAGGDLTSGVLFEKDVALTANIMAKEDCVLAGIDIARWVFNALDERISVRPLFADGDKIRKGKKIMALKGSARNILTGERTALNFLARLSGIATLTDKFVKKARPGRSKIFDTRKTTPGMRELEKYAVRTGGGCNHRMGLWDGILIKDNHLEALKAGTGLSKSSAIRDAVDKAKKRGYKNVEIEVNSLSEFKTALGSGVDIIMLDNMKSADIKKAIKLRDSGFKAGNRRPELEVSGGITLENISDIARMGVDRISIGALTHSAPSIDFSLDITPTTV